VVVALRVEAPAGSHGGDALPGALDRHVMKIPRPSIHHPLPANQQPIPHR
jgi:hypothetical protein